MIDLLINTTAPQHTAELQRYFAGCIADRFQAHTGSDIKAFQCLSTDGTTGFSLQVFTTPLDSGVGIFSFGEYIRLYQGVIFSHASTASSALSVARYQGQSNPRNGCLESFALLTRTH